MSIIYLFYCQGVMWITIPIAIIWIVVYSIIENKFVDIHVTNNLKEKAIELMKTQTPWKRSMNRRAKMVLPLVLGIIGCDIVMNWSVSASIGGVLVCVGLALFMFMKPGTIVAECILLLFLGTEGYAATIEPVPQIAGLTPQQQQVLNVKYQAEVDRLIAANSPPGEYKITIDVGGGKKVEMVAVIIVVGCIIAYAGWTGWKAYKAGVQKFNTRRKQIEQALTNAFTRSINGPTSWAMSTTLSTHVAGSMDEEIKQFCFDFKMGGGITKPHIGRPDLSVEEYYNLFGLPYDFSKTHYSEDGMEVAEPSVVSLKDGVYTVNVSGEWNMKVTVIRSPDMVTWTSLGTLSAPKGRRVSFEDSSATTDNAAMFYRLVY